MIEYSRDSKTWRTAGSVWWPVFEDIRGGLVFVSYPGEPVALESGGAKILFKVYVLQM